jgi:enamine deaminase RidA (YjgF/YER057c/UK114 family)
MSLAFVTKTFSRVGAAHAHPLLAAPRRQTAASSCRRLIHIEKRLEELGITLPTPSSPKANYNIVCHASGNMMYISGHLPFQTDGTLMTGRIGGEGGRDKDHGYQAARHAGLNIISTLKEQLGDLDRVEQIVKVRTKNNRTKS